MSEAEKKLVPYQEVRKIIEMLIEDRSCLSFDTRERELNAEGKVRLDYAGRVLFELLQNAIDRAATSIKVLADPENGRLYFGNDGNPVSVFPLKPGAPRSDLHSLCSLNTSNKSARIAIGNKGVGFRSVFSATNRVRVWSQSPDARSGDPRWWGVEFRCPFPGGEFPHLGVAPSLDERVRKNLETPPTSAPSFYFPRFLPEWDETRPPEAWLDGLVTVIVLEDLKVAGGAETALTTSGWEVLLKHLDTFQKSPLLFLSRKYPEKEALNVEVRPAHAEPSRQKIGPPPGWLLVKREVPEAAGEARKLELDLDRPEVVVAFPPPGRALSPHDGNLGNRSLLYAYLPTETPGGFSVLIHGDFFTDASRRHVDLEPNRARYNRMLLEAGVEAMYEALLTGKGLEGKGWSGPLILREDAWRFLNPEGANEHVKRMVFEKIIGVDSRWRKLCSHAFSASGDKPLGWYHEFWKGLAGWWPLIRLKRKRKPYSDRGTGLPKVAQYLVAWMEKERLPCWPLIDARTCQALSEEEVPREVLERKVPAVALSIPPKKKGARYERTVFVRVPRDREDVSGLGSLPRAIRESDMDLTWYSPPEPWDLRMLPVVPFDSERLLEQINNALSGRKEDLKPEDCRQLLRFAWQMVHDPALAGGIAELPPSGEAKPTLRWTYEGGKDPGAQARRRRALEALARIPLPVRKPESWADGPYPRGWAPAGSCTRPLQNGGALPLLQVDGGRLPGELDPTGLVPPDSRDIERFLCWLGAWGGPPLVEDPDTRLPCLPWDPASLDRPRREALARMLGKAWAEYAPAFEKKPFVFRQQLCDSVWFPADGEDASLPLSVWVVERRRFQRPLPFMSTLEVGEDGRPPFPEPFLEALGIVRLAKGAPAGKIAHQLRRMREEVPDPMTLNGHTRTQVFRPLYRNLTEWLPTGDAAKWEPKEIPILCETREEKGGRWRTHWADTGTPGKIYYLIRRDYRKWRNLFPGASFTLIEVAGVATQLGCDPFTPRVEPRGDTEDDTHEVKSDLAPHMPVLLAVAEAARVGGTQLEMVDVCKRWNLLKVRWGPDVYLDVFLEGKPTEDPPGKGRIGDVYPAPSLGKSAKDTLPVIFEDIPRKGAPHPTLKWGRENRDRYIPSFADALADMVFGNAGLGTLFERALRASSSDPDDLDRLLSDLGTDKEHVDDLRGNFESKILDTTRRAEAMAALREVLTPFGSLKDPDNLPLHEITPDVFERIAGDITEDRLTERAGNALGDIPIRPAVRFQDLNRSRWNEYKRTSGKSVLLWIIMKKKEILERWTRDDVKSLTDAWDACEPATNDLARLGYRPGETAEVFWKEQRTPVPFPDLDTALKTIPEEERKKARSVLKRVPFARLESAAKGARIMPRTAGKGLPAPGRFDGEKEARSAREKKERGQGAEKAYAEIAADNLRQYMEGAGDGLEGWNAIRSEMENVSVLSRDVPMDPADLTDKELARMLRIAGRNDSTGYDVIDVNPKTGRLYRVEVKSSESRGKEIEFHLSENERRLAVTYLKEAAGAGRTSVGYRLVCYQGLSRCIDVTELVEKIVARPENLRAVDQLRTGLVPEGYVIHITLT